MLLNCGVGEDSWESLGLQGDPTSPFWRSALGFLWKEKMLKLKLQHFGHLMWRVDSLEGTWCWERLKAGERDDRGWHHRLNKHESEQAPGIGDGQGSLACCSPWGSKESDMTEQLSWTELNQIRCNSTTIIIIKMHAKPKLSGSYKDTIRLKYRMVLWIIMV